MSINHNCIYIKENPKLTNIVLAVVAVPAQDAGAVVGVVGELAARARILAGIGVTRVLGRPALGTLVLWGAAALVLRLGLVGAVGPVLTREALAGVHFRHAVIPKPAHRAGAGVVADCREAGGVVLAWVGLAEVHLKVNNSTLEDNGSSFCLYIAILHQKLTHYTR